MNQWIDFKALRASLSFEQVLRHYGVEVKAKGGKQHHGYCPLPNHNGKRNSASFSANLEKGIFNCFGCGAKGNLIDFAVLMERLNPESGADVRKAALILQERFCPAQPAKKEPKPKRHEAPQMELAKEDDNLPVVVNAPLDFELKNLDANHPYLDKRGFERAIIQQFGLGFCGKGLLAGRIAIPVHTPDAKLVGYAGRLVDDSLISEDNPRYKFPPKRERNGIVYEFHKTELVYNAHRIKSRVENLAVVEGFASVWWLTQMGLPDVAAVMGSSISEKQATIIVELVLPKGCIWIITDGDPAGDRCATEMFLRLASFRFVRRIPLDEGKQPTDYPGGFFKKRFER